MAFRRSLSEEDLTCPICCDVFQDPVILSCSHSFCQACFATACHKKLWRQCPLCRRRSDINPPPSNLALRNLCEGFIRERDLLEAVVPEEQCPAHEERLSYFCQVDRELLCSVCCTSRRHKQHKFCPVEETTAGYREQLKSTLSDFQKKLSGLHDLQHHYSQIKKQIKCQVYSTGQQITEEFKRLHQFLQDEEKERMAALAKEGKEKKTATKKKIGEIGEMISTLESTVNDIEEALGASDVQFLLMHTNMMSTIGSISCAPAAPEKVSGSLVDMALHLGNLKFAVWKKMWEIVEYSPVILDPNTSQAKLVLSESLTSVVNSSEKQRVPYNPERFLYYPCVLGSQSLSSGLHSWDVDVGDSATWCVGVTTASNPRQGNTFFHANTCFVSYQDAEYACHPPGGPAEVLMTGRLRVIRVRLDCDGGVVAFSGVSTDHDQPLCSFRHDFREGVYPFLYNYCKIVPLKILPLRVSKLESVKFCSHCSTNGS